MIEPTEEVNSDNIKCDKAIRFEKEINSFIKLADNRIAVCSKDKTVKIFNPSNNYDCDKIINTKDEVLSIFELEDDTLVFGTKQDSLIIGAFRIINAHLHWVTKVIPISNNRIASCSYEKTIKIWNSSPPYNNKPLKELQGHDVNVSDILFLKEKDLLISGAIDGLLIIWNMTTYDSVSIIKGVKCNVLGSIYPIDNKKLLCCDSLRFYIVNYDKCKIENYVEDSHLGGLYTGLKLRDNNTIIIGCTFGNFCLYDMTTKKHKMIKKSGDFYFNKIVSIDNETFITSSDKSIKVWHY